MLIARLRIGFLLATLVATLHAAAEPRFWTLTGVQFEDGAVATGYFSYDDATGTIANWNLRVSGGAEPFIPWTFVPGNSHPWFPQPLYVYSYLPSLVPGFWWRSLVIRPLGALDGSSTTVSIDVSTAFGDVANGVYVSHDFFENDYDGGNPFGRVGRSRKIIAGSLALTTSPPPTQQIDINQHGLTGAWYNPATSGQGIQLEVYPNMVAPGTGFLHGGWFTYKDTGYWDYDWEQRWYSFSGNVLAGQASATLTIYQNVGGNFNAPSATSGTSVGTAVLSFQDCATATMQYVFIDGSDRSGVIPLVRLTPNVTCSTSGDTLTSADFGYSGNWFDPVTSGQGLIFEVNPNAATMFFAWATYAPEGQSQGAAGQRWYVGQGSYLPGTPTAAVTLYETCCGSFNEFASTQIRAVGTATVAFQNCRAASLTFDFTGGTNAAASGTINLSRLGPTPADCLR